jgi:hypothetical protein
MRAKDTRPSCCELEYLERAVAAARATFAVAPWENWAHSDDSNAPGAMTSVEINSLVLGDLYINLERKQGVGFNATSLRALEIKGSSISFAIETLPGMSRLTVKFAGANSGTEYRIICNGAKSVAVRGEELNRTGYTVDLGKP